MPGKPSTLLAAILLFLITVIIVDTMGKPSVVHSIQRLKRENGFRDSETAQKRAAPYSAIIQRSVSTVCHLMSRMTTLVESMRTVAM